MNLSLLGLVGFGLDSVLMFDSDCVNQYYLQGRLLKDRNPQTFMWVWRMGYDKVNNHIFLHIFSSNSLPTLLMLKLPKANSLD